MYVLNFCQYFCEWLHTVCIWVHTGELKLCVWVCVWETALCVLGWRNAFACADPGRLSALILNESLLQYSVGGAKVGSPAANPVKHTRMHDFSLSPSHTHCMLSHPALRSTVWPIISCLHNLWPQNDLTKCFKIPFHWDKETERWLERKGRKNRCWAGISNE